MCSVFTPLKGWGKEKWRKGRGVCVVWAGSESLLWACLCIVQCDFKTNKFKFLIIAWKTYKPSFSKVIVSISKIIVSISPLIIVLSWEIRLSSCVSGSVDFDSELVDSGYLVAEKAEPWKENRLMLVRIKMVCLLREGKKRVATSGELCCRSDPLRIHY